MESLVDLKDRLLKNGCQVGHGSSHNEILEFETKNGILIDQNIRNIFSQLGPVEFYSSWIIINIWSVKDWKTSTKPDPEHSLFVIGDILLDSDFLINAVESDRNPIRLNSDHSVFSSNIYSLFDSLTKPFE